MSVSISLTVNDSVAALAFYAKAFGAEEKYRMPNPDGGTFHAEFTIGETLIYMSDDAPDWHAKSMPAGALASCLFSIGTDDCDTAYRTAVAAGAKSLSEPADQFWGARSAMVADPFGYRWCFVQMTEELSPEELAKRAASLNDPYAKD